MSVSPVAGRRGGRMFVGVRGGAIWVVRPLPVAAVAALVTAGMGVFWAVRWLAIAAATANSSAWAAEPFAFTASWR